MGIRICPDGHCVAWRLRHHCGNLGEKFEQLAALQNFIVLPLTFLSGVFYTIPSLPPLWRGLSYLNPFFYLVDGFRYGFFRVSDVSRYLSLGTLLACFRSEERRVGKDGEWRRAR